MEKKFFTLLAYLCFIALPGFAQFNHDYDSTACPNDIVACRNGTFVTMSVTGFRKYDFNGNLIWERYYDNLPVTYPGNSSICRMVNTEDDGVIYFTINQNHLPAAVKLDVNGDVVWAHTYSVFNDFGEDVLLDNYLGVDAERMHTGNEQYIMVTSGSMPKNTRGTYRKGASINVLTIDANGGLIWNRRYYAPNSGPDYVRDFASTITYGGYDAVYGNVYYIAGLQERNTSGAYKMFQMLIDENSNIIVPYQLLSLAAPRHIDAIYDENEDAIIVSATVHNTIFGATNQVGSQMGWLRVNRSLTVEKYNYYWMDNTNENFSSGIDRSVVNGDYIITGLNYNRDIFRPFGDYNGVYNSILLRIDKTGKPIFYKHYMVEENSQMVMTPSVISHLDATGTTEQIVFPGLSQGIHTMNGYKARLIGTDANGDVCGSYAFPILYDAKTVTSAAMGYSYEDLSWQNTLTLTEQPTSVNIDYCKYDSRYGYKAGSLQVNNIDVAALVEVYPTLLLQNYNFLNISLPGENAETGIFIYSSDGRVVQQETFTTRNHKDVKKMDVSGLAPGSYFIHIQSAGMGIDKNIHIVRL